MHYTRLGRTGLQVSRLCLGTMNFGPQASEADSIAIMDAALEQGINFIDTANAYGISRAHLMKVVNILTRTGFIRGVRGRSGGFPTSRETVPKEPCQEIAAIFGFKTVRDLYLAIAAERVVT